MPANQRSCSGVWGEALGDPRDMAKAGLPEVKSPGGAKLYARRKDACNRRQPLRQVLESSAASLWGMERCPVRTFKEMSWPPKSR